MSVRSQNLDNGEPVTAPSFLSELIAREQTQRAKAAPPVTKVRMSGGTRAVLGLVLCVFGLLQWIPAARFTVDGWLLFLNTFGGWLGFPAMLPTLRAAPLVLAMVGIGLVYSWVETKCMPVQRAGDGWAFMGAMALVGWLFITATDVGSTYAGMVSVGASAPQALRDLASNRSLAAFVSFYLTFAPDWFIIGGIYLMGLGRALAWLGRIFWRR